VFDNVKGKIMLTSVSVVSVKKCEPRECSLGPVTLFAGDNESGKTGMMEALRLALTGRGDIGAKNQLQALLVNGASASSTVKGEVDGKPVVGAWALTSKESKDGTIKNSVAHDLTWGGVQQRTEFITAGLPVTATEFWALTGEDKWAAIEQVVGKFDLPQPADPKDIKAKIDELTNRQQPERYSGDPIALLREKSRGLSEWILEQQKLRKHLAYREQKLTTDRARMAQHEEDLAKWVAGSTTVEERLSRVMELRDALQPMIDAWTSSPEALINPNGDNLLGILGEYVDSMRTQGELIYELVSDFPELAQKIDAILAVAGLLDVTLQEQEPKLREIHPASPDAELIRLAVQNSGLLEDGDNKSHTSTPAAAQTWLDREQGFLKSQYAAALNKIESFKNAIADLKASTSDESFRQEACASEDSIAAKAQELSVVQSDLSKAEEWQRWVESSQRRLEEIAELRAQLEAAETAMKGWQQQRSEYMMRNIASITTIANSILSDIGCTPVTLSVETTGKRNTLTLTAAGTDILAMAGSQQVIYGAALLHALQILSVSPCPVLFIRASEIHGSRLGMFLDSLATHRVRGNVFVEHWYVPKVERATIINL
jgi:hypothetical protein